MFIRLFGTLYRFHIYNDSTILNTVNKILNYFKISFKLIVIFMILHDFIFELFLNYF